MPFSQKNGDALLTGLRFSVEKKKMGSNKTREVDVEADYTHPEGQVLDPPVRLGQSLAVW